MRTRSAKKPRPAATKRPPSCTVCGRKIKVRPDGKIVGAYYFGKLPLYRKSELDKMSRSGTRRAKVGPLQINVAKYNPKPYKHIEYWECIPCYRKPRSR